MFGMREGARCARSGLVAALLMGLLALLGGCDGDDEPTEPGQETPAKGDESTGEQDDGLDHGLTEEQASQVLAKVGDRVITLGDFADQLANQSPYLRARYNSPERRREFLENMIRFELLALEAKERGHDQRPEVQRVRRQVMVQQMMKQLFDEDGIKLSDIGDDEIKAYYEEHRSEFVKPAQVRASLILVKDKGKAEKLLAEAKAKPADMNAFRKLAREHNTDPKTKGQAGDLGFFYADPSLPNQPNVPEVVREAAFDMSQIGAVYDTLVKDDAGYYIVKLTGKRAPLERSLEDARRLIQNRLWRERRTKAIEDFVDELREKANVEEDLSLLKDVRVRDPKRGSAKQGAPNDAAQGAH